jgi:hypothetical protein
MDREIKKSGLSLICAGAVGLVFFWLTDPIMGVGRKNFPNPVDAMNEASLGTLAGIAGSVALLALGLWMMTRKPT